MHVGVNYPWFDYGWDFGSAPPGWRGGTTSPRWHSAIDDHLRHLQNLGVTVIRWFILADGLSYGVGANAPTPDGINTSEWRFDPPPLEEGILRDFEELLKKFAGATEETGRPIQLIPVLIDFHFCLPGTRPVQTLNPSDPIRPVEDPAWVKGGRADALIDATKRKRFLDAVLEPLLRVSRQHRETIYAWELINEPDWITKGWHSNRRASTPVPQSAMRGFIEEGKQRIRAAGFKPTIGFASIRTLRNSGITAEINQFHYYPGGSARLERHAFDPAFPGIIGEFATAAEDVWPDLTDVHQSVLHRLRKARAQGYPLAIPWSFRAHDRHTMWSAAVENDIRAFTSETG